MTGEPWPGVLPGVKPEINRLVDFKTAKGGAELDKYLERPRSFLSMPRFSLRRVSREMWKKITNDDLR